MADVCGMAVGRIPYGAKVLVRGGRAALADDAVANATANPRPRFGPGPWAESYQDGEFVYATPIEGLGPRDLHALAQGPIMDPVRIYLPAGKLSEADYRARLQADFESAGIGKDERP